MTTETVTLFEIPFLILGLSFVFISIGFSEYKLFKAKQRKKARKH